MSKDVLTCLEEPVWHLWLSCKGQGLKTWLPAWGGTSASWNNRHTKKIYRKTQKKGNPQLREPLVRSAQSRGYSIFLRPRSWVLCALSLWHKKPHEKQDAPATCSCREVSFSWREITINHSNELLQREYSWGGYRADWKLVMQSKR